MSDAELYGAVEAGGTKFLCGIGSAPQGSLETIRIDTGDPETTLAQVIAFFEAATARHGAMRGLGVGSFGPLDLDRRSPGYGRILATPKPGWRGVDMPTELGRRLGLPVCIDTDVNAAACAEAWVGRVSGTLAYVTVGTGIGVGIAGAAGAGGHAEAGHLLLRRHPAHESFTGVCPFHGDCLEGLASGPAIEAFWHASLNRLPTDHPAVNVEADYLGQLCAILVLTLSPDRIVLGGGVMGQGGLLSRIRRTTSDRLAGYVERLSGTAAMDALIIAPQCTEPPGLVGAYLLAQSGV